MVCALISRGSAGVFIGGEDEEGKVKHGLPLSEAPFAKVRAICVTHKRTPELSEVTGSCGPTSLTLVSLLRSLYSVFSVFPNSEFLIMPNMAAPFFASPSKSVTSLLLPGAGGTCNAPVQMFRGADSGGAALSAL